MLSKDFYYDGGIYKIIEPSKELKEEILVKMINYSKNKDNNVDISFDSNFLLFLCQKLVISENEDYQFDKYSLDDFVKLLIDTPIELETIINTVVDIVTKIQINFMIQQKLKLRQQYIETLSLQMNEEVENIQKEFFKDVKFEKKVKDIRRINDLNKNGLEDKRKEVERLDKLVQGKNNKKKFFNKKNKKNK